MLADKEPQVAGVGVSGEGAELGILLLCHLLGSPVGKKHSSQENEDNCFKVGETMVDC